MQVGKSLKLTTNRNLLVCVVALVFGIAMYSWSAIQSQSIANEKANITESKLDFIIKKVNEDDVVGGGNTTTYIIVPSDELPSGKISSFNNTFFSK